MKKLVKRIAIVILAAVIAAAGLFAGWAKLGSYRADETALTCLNGTDAVSVTKETFGWFFDGAGDESALIFYPGAFVDCEAYAPLMGLIAQSGTDCFLVRMPLNFALMGSDKADAALKLTGGYSRLYIGGHSLGGTAASLYLAKHADDFAGIIFFASYPSADLSGLDVSALSIYGSEDGVLNMENLTKGMDMLPPDVQRVCIEGGNHAFFGAYGLQRGDGDAAITPEAQWAETASAVESFIGA